MSNSWLVSSLLHLFVIRIMNRLPFLWLIASLLYIQIVRVANSLQRAQPIGQFNPIGLQNLDLSDEGWVEIDEEGFPINPGPTRKVAPAANQVPGFIQALTNGEFGPSSPFQVLQASDGSAVYLVPGRRPMDRIPTEQDITVNEIFRLFDRLNKGKDPRRENALRREEFEPMPPLSPPPFNLPPFPLPPPQMPAPFFAPPIPPFVPRMPLSFGPPRQRPPWLPNFPFPRSPIAGPMMLKRPMNFASIPQQRGRMPLPNSSADLGLNRNRPSITAPVIGERRQRNHFAPETIILGPRIGKSSQQKSWFSRPPPVRKPDGATHGKRFSKPPL